MQTSKYFLYSVPHTSNFAGVGMELWVQYIVEEGTVVVEAICVGDDKGYRLDPWLEQNDALDSVSAEISKAILAQL